MEKDVQKTNIEELHTLVKRLDGLLSDPHPGLASWVKVYGDTMEQISVFWNGN